MLVFVTSVAIFCVPLTRALSAPSRLRIRVTLTVLLAPLSCEQRLNTPVDEGL